MAKESAAAERILAAFTGQTTNPRRSAAGRKGNVTRSFKARVGKKGMTQGGNPYWGLSDKTSTPGSPLHFAGQKPGPTTTFRDVMRKPTRRVTATIGKTTRAPGRIEKFLLSPEGKGMGIGILLAALMNKVGGQVDEMRQADLAKETMDLQAESMSPEALYYQNALPSAQNQEQQLAQAVLGRLASGGVLGPSLAKGEYSIGG